MNAEPKHTVLVVDCVVLNQKNELLVIRRGKEPFKGKYALPGGRVNYGESTSDAARRELLEETGIEISAANLRLVGVYSDPDRDPRGHYVSTAYLAEIPKDTKVQAGDDAAIAKFTANWQGLDFAFDHHRIVSDALKVRDSDST